MVCVPLCLRLMWIVWPGLRCLLFLRGFVGRTYGWGVFIVGRLIVLLGFISNRFVQRKFCGAGGIRLNEFI